MLAMASDPRAADAERDAAIAALESLTPTRELVSRLAAELAFDPGGEAASRVLARFGDRIAAEVVPAIIAQLPATSTPVRHRLIVLLGRYGPRARCGPRAAADAP